MRPNALCYVDFCKKSVGGFRGSIIRIDATTVSPCHVTTAYIRRSWFKLTAVSHTMAATLQVNTHTRGCDHQASSVALVIVPINSRLCSSRGLSWMSVIPVMVSQQCEVNRRSLQGVPTFLPHFFAKTLFPCDL